MTLKLTHLCSAAAVILCSGILSCCSLPKQMNDQLSALPFPRTDMTAVHNGTYIGTAETILVKADVSVEIKAGQIQQIKILRHVNGKGKKAEAITKAMQAANTWDVDSVSGATASSLVLKSAAAQAIAKGAE
jgi:uncharacterized protein with FMN-binding domain